MKILFGVFDWGLGHATRDTPLIEELLKRGHTVDIISTGRALKILESRFNNKCKFFDVPSIFVPYPENGSLVKKFIKNIPRMMIDMKKAREISEQIIKNGKYNKIISDCRYDVYDKIENSYLINHQIKIKAPMVIAESGLKGWLALRMNKYKFIIVPDFDKNNLTGELSHNFNYFKDKIKYIGILSHIRKKQVQEDIDFFISISGPEPQRTVLEKKILPILPKLKGKVFVTLGNPENNQISSDKNITITGFLNSEKQEEIMNRAKFIISRSGYTTVMEISELEKKNILFIPTPGQTEQEYLADLYEQNKYFHHIPQDELDLLKDIKDSENFKGYKPEWKTKESIKKFIEVVEV